ncbi:hypothetical protein RIF29_27915 [Crotalaria pallida]|uniref:Uncharacterized protein n=1 Tax=Crotalaria pallida TaxID=3830 RepID=A0AAN9EUU3_CROPI
MKGVSYARKVILFALLWNTTPFDVYIGALSIYVWSLCNRLFFVTEYTTNAGRLKHKCVCVLVSSYGKHLCSFFCWIYTMSQLCIISSYHSLSP